MDSPVRVAIRILSADRCDNPDIAVIKGSVDENAGIQYVQAGSQVYPASAVWSSDITQAHLYNTIIRSNISAFLEGYDASVITYGQSGTGKTYTIFGPGIHCAFSETEHGIIPRTFRDIFTSLSNLPERNFVMNISWFQIHYNDVIDLLDDVSCNVQVNTVSEAFYWLQHGLTNISQSEIKGHLLFTICLEQQWTNQEGYIQHRLSTMSFCDLVGTERVIISNEIGEQLIVPQDPGLRNLENVIHILSDPNIHRFPNYQNFVPYNQSTLTTLLMDSLGGRARTVLICCVSPLTNDLPETLSNLQIACKAQNIRNNVVLNAFSDNNTIAENQIIESKKTMDTFGLQFAASQWIKLVTNAEGLFSRLISNKVLSEQDAEQIEQWLFLKQECEDCLSSGENITRQLRSIAEEQPQDYVDSASECSANEENSKIFQRNESQNNFPESISDTEGLEQSDNDSHKDLELNDMVDNMMKNFRDKTAVLTKDRFEHFILSQPKSALNSINKIDVNEAGMPEEDCSKNSFFSALFKDMGRNFNKSSVNSEPVYCKGRRRSVQPGQSLSSIELQLLQRAASSGSAVLPTKSRCDSQESSMNDIEFLKIKLRDAEAELESILKQVKTVKETIALKSQLLRGLAQNNDTRVHAKQKFTRKKCKLEYELTNAKKHLAHASNYLLNHNNTESRAEVEKWRVLTKQYEQRLKDIFAISEFSSDSKNQSGELHTSLKELEKQLNVLQSQSKNMKKIIINLEKEIKIKKKNEHLNKPEKKKSQRCNKQNISH